MKKKWSIFAIYLRWISAFCSFPFCWIFLDPNSFITTTKFLQEKKEIYNLPNKLSSSESPTSFLDAARRESIYFNKPTKGQQQLNQKLTSALSPWFSSGKKNPPSCCSKASPASFFCWTKKWFPQMNSYFNHRVPKFHKPWKSWKFVFIKPTKQFHLFISLHPCYLHTHTTRQQRPCPACSTATSRRPWPWESLRCDVRSNGNDFDLQPIWRVPGVPGSRSRLFIELFFPWRRHCFKNG